jgi:hypothetical protein
MKTAILFSGQLRGFNHSASNIKENIIDMFPSPYVFFYGPPDPNGLDVRDYFSDATVMIEKDDLSCVQGINPAGVGGISDKASIINGHEQKKFVEHFALQFYGVLRAFQLAEKYKDDFDIFVRIRPCTYTLDKMSFVPPQPSSLYLPNFDHYCGGMNDKFAYGDYDSMKVYCSFYNDVPYMKNGVGGAENRMLAYLQNSGLNLYEILQFTFAGLNYDGSIRGVPNLDATPEHIDLTKWEKLYSESYHTEFAMSHSSIVDEPEKIVHDEPGRKKTWAQAIGPAAADWARQKD